MSDVTHARKAEALLGASPDAAATGRAGAHASLAVARALRELDESTKHGANVVSGAVGSAALLNRDEAWLVWDSDDGQRIALATSSIEMIKQQIGRAHV